MTQTNKGLDMTENEFSRWVALTLPGCLDNTSDSFKIALFRALKREYEAVGYRWKNLRGDIVWAYTFKGSEDENIVECAQIILKLRPILKEKPCKIIGLATLPSVGEDGDIVGSYLHFKGPIKYLDMLDKEEVTNSVKA